jgi:hypothetical protein
MMTDEYELGYTAAEKTYQAKIAALLAAGNALAERLRVQGYIAEADAAALAQWKEVTK